MSDYYIYTYDRRIFFADTDAGGVVYYANYLQYFEEARAEYIRSIGIPLDMLPEKNCVPVVREAHVEYKAPARLDDLIHVDLWIEERTNVAMLFKYIIRRDSKTSGDPEILVEGWTKLVACQFKRDGRIAVTRMPAWLTGPMDEVGVKKV